MPLLAAFYSSASYAQSSALEQTESVEAAVTTDNQADLTETIVTEGIIESQQPSSPAAGAYSSSADITRTNVSGWVRESLELYPYDEGLRRSDASDVAGVPRDRLVSRTQLLVRASHQQGRWFEVAASGVVGLSAHVEGTGRDLAFYELASQGTTVLSDARLLELYLGFFAGSFDLRIGQQRVAWGVADILSPNDVVNARDLRDPFLAEPELLRLPTPLLRGTFYAGPLSLELLFAPLFVPDKTSLYGRNWSAIQPDAPAAYRGLLALTARIVDPSVQEEVNGALYQTRLPNRNGEGMSLGAKLGLHTESVDGNLYYHYGYDGTPYLWLDPAFANVLAGTDFSKAGLAELAPLLRAVDGGLTPLLAEYVRRHHVGIDAVVPAGPFMLRVDAAYQSQRVFYRADLTGLAAPALLGVVSLDYQSGRLDRVLVVEGVYIRILDSLRGPLLVYERDSYGVGVVSRWALDAMFGFELRALLGVAPRFYSVQPALVAKVRGLAVKVGTLLSDGEPNSLGGYYRHNTTAFLQVRCGF